MLNNIKKFLAIIKNSILNKSYLGKDNSNDFIETRNTQLTIKQAEDEISKKNQEEEQALSYYLLGLAKQEDFQKLGDFLLNENSEKLLNDLSTSFYEILLDSSFRVFSNGYSNNQKLAYLKIMENDFILKKTISLHYKYLQENSSYYGNIYHQENYDTLISSHDDYNKITSKMFELNNDNELVYLGLNGLSEIERNLVLNQFKMIESIHTNFDFSQPYDSYVDIFLPINDLVMFGFLHENPKFHGSPMIFQNNLLIVSPSGTKNLLKQKISSEADKDGYKNIAITINNKYQTQFKSGAFLDDIHEQYLKKFHQRNGNLLDKELSIVSMPSDMAEILKNKYNELLNLEKNSTNDNFNSFIQASKKGILNFISFYPNMIDLAEEDNSKEMLKKFISNIDAGIQKQTVINVENLSTQKQVMRKIMK